MHLDQLGVWLPQSRRYALNKLNRNFLWGFNADRRKIHLVKWDKVTKHKKIGGLGVRDSRMANVRGTTSEDGEQSCLWQQKHVGSSPT